MNEWEYLVAVVRGAFQSLSRGMAGAARGYKESSKSRPAVNFDCPGACSKEDAAREFEEGFRREHERMATDPAYSIYAGNASHYREYER